MGPTKLRAHWLTLFWVAVAAITLLAAALQVNAALVAIPILTGVVVQVVSTRREKGRARLEHVRTQIDVLYAPWTRVAEALLERSPDTGYVQRFRQHMDGELGQLHRHLAEDSTLAAYDSPDRKGLGAYEADLKLARVFLEDHRRLVEEFRRLARE